MGLGWVVFGQPHTLRSRAQSTGGIKMVETSVLFALAVGGILVLFFILNHFKIKVANVEVVPGWNDSPRELKDTCPEGDLFHELVRAHKGGRCPIRAFWWKNQRVVSLCSPTSYKETENLHHRPQCFYGHDALHGPKALQNLNDFMWMNRKSVLHKCVRGDNLDYFYPTFVSVSQEVVSKWCPGETIEVLSEMYSYFMRVIINTMFDNTITDEEIQDLVILYDNCKIKEESKFEIGNNTYSEGDLNFSEDVNKLQGYMKKMLHYRKNSSRSDLKFSLIDALLESNYDEDEIVSHMLNFLGGYHTISYFATWLLLYLVNNNDIQEKLASEIAEKVNDNVLDKYSQTSSSYMRQVIDEALRLSTTALFTIHSSDKDMVVEGFCIPADTPIVHALGVTQCSSEFWENPLQYDPDRFSTTREGGTRDRKFRPFGVSCTRRCPANLFVYQIVSVFLALLIQRYILLPVEIDKEVKSKARLTASPANKVYIMMKERQVLH